MHDIQARSHIKTALTVAVLLAVSLGAQARGAGSSSHTKSTSSDHQVQGYTKKDGTYVAPHNATNPNDTQRDNYGSKGVVNPYTGKEGTKEPAR